MRHDCRLRSRATGFAIHPHDPGAPSRHEVAGRVDESLREGRILPLSLVSDDDLRVRVVIGEGLDERERDEWVGHASWWLDLREGKLVLEGGFDSRGRRAEAGLVQVVPVEPGRYVVDVYAYLNSPNGDWCLNDAGIADSPIDWFHRSHPGTPVPRWFAELFEEWWPDDETLPADDDEPGLVDYVVHLRPLEGDPPAEAPELVGGWLPREIGARVPPRCPVGIPAAPTPMAAAP